MQPPYTIVRVVPSHSTGVRAVRAADGARRRLMRRDRLRRVRLQRLMVGRVVRRRIVIRHGDPECGVRVAIVRLQVMRIGWVVSGWRVRERRGRLVEVQVICLMILMHRSSARIRWR